jgi:hypothetical protein
MDFCWRFDRKGIVAQFWRMRQNDAPLRLARSIGSSHSTNDARRFVGSVVLHGCFLHFGEKSTGPNFKEIPPSL